jgi:hypothetical protein
LTIKTNKYWAEINSMAEEVGRLSSDIQGPLIEQHMDHIDHMDMGIDEITEYLEQFYDDDELLAWSALEVRGMKLAEETGVTPTEMSNDLWTLVSNMSDISAPTQTRH